MNKNLLLLIAIFSFSLTTSAQITNGGFEAWTSGPGSCMSVTDWGTLNGDTYLIGICTTVQESSNVHGGSYALRLSTEHVVIPFPPIDQLAPGICTNGTINTQTEAVEGGDAFTERPTAFTGWYIAGPVNNDTYSFSALLINENNGDTVGVAEWSGNTVVNTYTQFSAPVVYAHPENPTLLQITLLPSDPGNPQENSFVTFDDLDYETITVGISEEESSMIQTYPNPVMENVYFNMGRRNAATVSIYNILGVKMMERHLTGSDNSISMADVSGGTYIWQFSNDYGEVLKTGKLLLVK